MKRVEDATWTARARQAGGLPEPRASLPALNKIALMCAATLALWALWLPIVFIGRSQVNAAGRFWWLADDMMISLRYARNLARGAGLVWNPGERVEGFSNFLWTLYMSAIHLLPIPASHTALVILLTNIALAALTLAALVRLVETLGGGSLAQIATLAGFALNQDALTWTTFGFETALMALIVIVAADRILREARSNQVAPLTYFLIAALALVRADGIALAGLLYAFAFFVNPNRKRVVVYALLSLLLPAAYEMFRLYYYGDLLPNTAYLKTANWDGRYVAGARYVLGFARQYAFALAFAALGVISLRASRGRWLVLVILAYAIYVAYIGGDSIGGFRFFAPIIPLLLALACVSIEQMRVPRVATFAAGILVLVTMPLINPISALARPSLQTGNGNIEIGLLIAQNTPPSSRVADYMVGTTFYFSDRYGIDLLGRIDSRIARLDAHPNLLMPGHSKWDFDYSLQTLKPDFVTVPFKLPIQADQLDSFAPEDWYSTFVRELYLNPTFHAHCLPNPIAVETFRAIFVCDWSPEAAKKDQWHDLRPGE